MSMTITSKSKKFEVSEPTIREFCDVMKLKDILSEDELNVRLIEKVTGMSHEDVMEMDAVTIQKIGSVLFAHYNKESKKLTQSFQLNGVTYKFMDVNTISFGQFVDIDTFLKKDESYRISNLNELMAYMYCEEGTKYSESNFKKRIEIMLDAPSHIIESSLFFLSSLEKGLYELMELSSKSPLMFQLMKLKIAFHRFGDTTRLFRFLLKTKFGRLILSLIWVLLLPLIICHILLTSIMRGKG
jgi:hypothetical protein